MPTPRECHHCGSDRFHKNGSHQGIQRYLCRNCKRTFTDKGLRYPQFTREVKQQAVDMYLNNVGIRKIARFVKASAPAVLRWIKKAKEEMPGEESNMTKKDNRPDVIEMDEIYTFVKKKHIGCSSGRHIAGNCEV
jgi:transposase-like protein